jgi:acetate kinase
VTANSYSYEYVSQEAGRGENNLAATQQSKCVDASVGNAASISADKLYF